ncbi:hypothetical protein NDU88_009746 [Pleurodeles waltl]|uniref:Uncharacterized protein n=1 Tax=Pleurodeles waltl TaxID=8319 RepID=A0AAV7RZA9_PLEWA|nr:hypothetical protein NDU88_009746 [Pleurodeles waltl]
MQRCNHLAELWREVAMRLPSRIEVPDHLTSKVSVPEFQAMVEIRSRGPSMSKPDFLARAWSLCPQNKDGHQGYDRAGFARDAAVTRVTNFAMLV